MANFALHISLTEEEKAQISSIVTVKIVKKNEIILRAGEVCRYIYFVDAGCLRVYYMDQHGVDHTASFSPENWWAVDMASFSRQQAAHYTIQALENSTLIAITHPALEQLYADVPKMERFFRILTENGYYHLQRRVTAGSAYPAEERYRIFRKRYPALETRIAQKYIASYLGITPVFLSRLRKRNLSGKSL